MQVLLLATLALPAVPPPATSDSLPHGPHGVGFRVVQYVDSALATSLQDGAPLGLPVRVHLWYPADATPCMRFADYLRWSQEGPATFPDIAPITDSAWATIADAPVRACADATPARGRHPVLIGRYLGGTCRCPRPSACRSWRASSSTKPT